MIRIPDLKYIKQVETISLETLFSSMFSKDDSAQVCTHTPLHTGSRGSLAVPHPTRDAGMQGGRQL